VNALSALLGASWRQIAIFIRAFEEFNNGGHVLQMLGPYVGMPIYWKRKKAELLFLLLS
jgi:hypothetical protein